MDEQAQGTSVLQCRAYAVACRSEGRFDEANYWENIAHAEERYGDVLSCALDMDAEDEAWNEFFRRDDMFGGADGVGSALSEKAWVFSDEC